MNKIELNKRIAGPAMAAGQDKKSNEEQLVETDSALPSKGELLPLAPSAQAHASDEGQEMRYEVPFGYTHTSARNLRYYSRLCTVHDWVRVFLVLAYKLLMNTVGLLRGSSFAQPLSLDSRSMDAQALMPI